MLLYNDIYVRLNNLWDILIAANWHQAAQCEFKGLYGDLLDLRVAFLTADNVSAVGKVDKGHDYFWMDLLSSKELQAVCIWKLDLDT